MMMRRVHVGVGVAIAACIAVTASVRSQGPAAGRAVTINSDGSVTVQNAVVQLSGLLSEAGRKVLMRTTPTEGPGAPVPVPSGIADMAEVRRIYNENLKPNVDHMREIFPVDIEETTIDGISVAIITPKGGVPAKNRNRLFLNGPGGGFRTGVRGNGLLISIPVAATLGVKVATITYRQSPEYRFPAASEDLLKVWEHFTKTYKPQNIGMVGCSAGGSLITHTTAMLIKQGKPAPGVLGVYCAGLGSTGSGDSGFMAALSVTNTAPNAPRAGGPSAAAGAGAPTGGRGSSGPSYMDGTDRTDFVINPTVDEKLLAKWPPTIFFTASRDGASSGALYSYRKLIKLGIDSQVMVFDGLYHGFMTNPDFPEAQEGYKMAAAFFDRHLGK
jgi:monoterpene epsilon-lactone hydrolase